MKTSANNSGRGIVFLKRFCIHRAPRRVQPPGAYLTSRTARLLIFHPERAGYIDLAKSTIKRI
ncbi:hypothetical protein KL86PLE_130228 [uncultured Pleomorphomonas sp.]|uniref:Uncharacterized protein n=1 Tax=uncultured Pleomorphomonas sp. TaxID=442121 RepID=A0A212LAW2_9HYPH|nr:hypothetical protein KL86PLE_130228 [uncultured Pleomorphomonas sp.]